MSEVSVEFGDTPPGGKPRVVRIRVSDPELSGNEVTRLASDLFDKVITTGGDTWGQKNGTVLPFRAPPDAG